MASAGTLATGRDESIASSAPSRGEGIGTPEVSVIIPCYNQGLYLSRALRSVLSQTHGNWEAIVVDDGSRDDTGQIATSVGDPRIRYIYRENLGLASARNTGIRAARGECLAFLDADDEWEPRFLERTVAVLGQDGSAAGVYTGVSHIDGEGTVLPQVGYEVVPPERLRERLLEGGFFPPCCVVVRAGIVREAAMFDTHLAGRGTEDWDLWLRLSQQHRIVGIAEPLARYRVYPGSMAAHASSMHANRMSVLAKHFAAPEGNPTAWPEEKRRAYGFAYRAVALGYMQQGEPNEGWKYLAQAVETWPWLLQRLDTFYELACGDQPRGFRGRADTLDIGANGGEMLRRLETLLAGSSPGVRALRPAAFGSAYLALGMLSDQAGDWSEARRYLLRALRSNPSLLRGQGVVRRLAKVTAGHRLVNFTGRALGRNTRDEL